MNNKTTIYNALQKGVEAHKAGKVQEADQYYTAVLNSQPNHPDANHNMGVLAVGVGQVDKSLPFFKKALEVNSTITQFWISYIDALMKLNKMDEAKINLDLAKQNVNTLDGFQDLEAILDKATTEVINYDPASSQMNSLTKLYREGDLQNAVEEANKLIRKFPKSAILLRFIGMIRKRLGQYDLSAKAFESALCIDPNCAEAYFHLGISYKALGRLEEAIIAYKEAIIINPEYYPAYNNMRNALTSTRIQKPNPDLQQAVTLLLNSKHFGASENLAQASMTLLKFDPIMAVFPKKCILKDLKRSLTNIITELVKIPLLLKYMSISPIPDLTLEHRLNALRSCILDSITEIPENEEILRFQSALALHCFTNEYIYPQHKSDTIGLQSIEAEIKNELLNGTQPKPQLVLCLASFKALGTFNWHPLLTQNRHIELVILSQITEPQRETELKSTLYKLGKVTDPISSKVKKQYEEHPYPRWVNAGLSLRQVSVSHEIDRIRISLLDKSIKEVGSPDILVAGCGTGQQSISTAARFKSSKVLAVDLSLSSLAYAKRKTEELNFSNIEYMQADILDLNKLDRTFDVIECTGVLHHMDDPLVGWKILTDCLKPGGLMKVGLYSELARQHIVKMREEINQLGLGSSDEDMKAFRELVIKSDEEHHKLILNAIDFYSTSMFRDLLFHVQEHRFTIPRIRDYLDELGLFFCGFESAPIVESFTRINGASDALYDLQNGRSMKMITQERLQVCTSSGVKKFHKKPLDKRHFYTP